MLLASTTCSISYQAVSSILYGVNVGDVVQGKFITPYPLFDFICGSIALLPLFYPTIFTVYTGFSSGIQLEYCSHDVKQNQILYLNMCILNSIANTKRLKPIYITPSRFHNII